ncbi:MAG: 23S rRNA (guanosine(2251)-2'-O)-methyltransferase RlmB [Coriobacteriales bacterium]|nr:23S rRNA (guanosine(2251)-2'-O)-methyltransferase RlmB [Coriobacteriales bacterium]
MPLRSVSIAEGTKPDRSLEEIERLAGRAGIPVKRAPRSALDARSERGSHQGVMAEAAPFKFAELADVLTRTADAPSSIIVVLDHVTDPGNLGAIARSAEFAGAAALVVPRHRSAAVTAAAWKASAGALAHLPLAQEANVARVIDALKDGGYWVAGASERAERTVWDAPFEGRIALVLGAEGEGLSRLAREKCDFLVNLPKAGKVGSLNVAQAGTALLFEWVRRERATNR